VILTFTLFSVSQTLDSFTADTGVWFLGRPERLNVTTRKGRVLPILFLKIMNKFLFPSFFDKEKTRSINIYDNHKMDRIPTTVSNKATSFNTRLITGPVRCCTTSAYLSALERELRSLLTLLFYSLEQRSESFLNSI
jgi:hypothetical protein